MPSVKLYKGAKKATNAMSYSCASFDFENAVIDQDYYIISNETSTFPATGEPLKQIRAHITAAGVNLLTGFDESPTSRQNLVLPPSYTMGAGTQSDPFNVDATEVPLGQKPTDWEIHYMTKYFTRNVLPVVNTNNYWYNYATAGDYVDGFWQPVWHDNVQYYEAANFAEIFYTDALGFFGVSRLIEPTSTGIQETVRALYNRRAYSSNLYYPGDFWWKSNGANGQILFYQNSLNAEKVMINSVQTQSNPINSYESRLLVQMIQFTYNDDTYTGIVVIKMSADSLPQEAEITALSAPFWREEITPAKGGENSTRAGGGGSFSGASDNRGSRTGGGISARTNDWNDINVVASANHNKYRLSMYESLTPFYQAVNRLWEPSVWNSITNNFFNPKDAIVACHLMPESLGPDAIGATDVIKAAEQNLSIANCPLFATTFTWKHIGDLDITDPHWYDGFPDFDNTAIYIHLPYIGVKQLDIEAVMEGVLSVDYVSDVMSGDVVATVWTQDRFGNCNYRYEFKGNCAKVVPLSARDNTMGGAIAGAAIKVGTNIALAAATSGMSTIVGNFQDFHRETGDSLLNDARDWGRYADTDEILRGVPSAAGKAAIGSANQLVNSVSAAGAGAGTLASNSAAGGISVPIDTQCYLIIERPKWSNPEHYGEQFGYPSDIGGTINDTPFEGFLSCRTIVLNGISATDVERSEIASYMASGVFV